MEWLFLVKHKFSTSTQTIKHGVLWPIMNECNHELKINRQMNEQSNNKSMHSPKLLSQVSMDDCQFWKEDESMERLLIYNITSSFNMYKFILVFPKNKMRNKSWCTLISLDLQPRTLAMALRSTMVYCILLGAFCDVFYTGFLIFLNIIY
jgi:hypothetical protein